MQELSPDEYALYFVADRLSRTLRYAESREATNRPEIITGLKIALSAVIVAQGGGAR